MKARALLVAAGVAMVVPLPSYMGTLDPRPSTLYAQSEILDVTPSQTKSDRGVVYVETSALNQRGEKVLSLRRRVLVPRRPA